MRILFIILSIFFLSPAKGQFIIDPYRFAVVGGSALIFDTYPGEAGYSLRKLRTAYAGSAVRVRRGGDNTESDIGFSGNDFDDATFTTFKSAGGGNGHAYVVTWYDQSGNAHDVTNGTASEQPEVILNLFTGRAAVVFDGSNDALAVSNFLSEPTTFSLYGVDSVSIGAGGNNGHFIQATGQGSTSHYPFVDENVYDGFGTTARKSAGSPPSALRAKHLYSAFSGSADWRNYVNNAAFYSTATNTGDVTSDFFIGYGGIYHTGVLAEVLVYITVHSTGDRNGVSGNINTYYTIY